MPSGGAIAAWEVSRPQPQEPVVLELRQVDSEVHDLVAAWLEGLAQQLMPPVGQVLDDVALN